MMLNHLEEVVEADGICYRLSGDEHGGGKEIAYPEPGFLEEFFLDCGLPTWRFSRTASASKSAWMMPHLQNTTYVVYRLLEGPAGVKLKLPALTPLSSARWIADLRTPAYVGCTTFTTASSRDRRRTQVPSLRLRLIGSSVALRDDIARSNTFSTGSRKAADTNTKDRCGARASSKRDENR